MCRFDSCQVHQFSRFFNLLYFMSKKPQNALFIRVSGLLRCRWINVKYCCVAHLLHTRCTPFAHLKDRFFGLLVCLMFSCYNTKFTPLFRMRNTLLFYVMIFVYSDVKKQMLQSEIQAFYSVFCMI